MKTDTSSSIVTGDSTQMNLEGQWDETIPIEAIHEGIVSHLLTKLERLKATYHGIKQKHSMSRNREELIMRKIVNARLNYQRYVAVTKDILQRCNEFMVTRKDTPESRIAFLRNAQDYFQQARDFVKLDITFKKISPSLIKYIEPKETDTPDVYQKKRELCRSMINVLGRDRTNQFTTGAGKSFRSRYFHHGKLFSRGFPSQWIGMFPVVLKDILGGMREELRWPLTLIFLFSKYCSRNFVHHGFCPGCYYPIINENSKEDKLISGGKLFCQMCGKEIEWTYYLNPRRMRTLFSSFHPEEISEMKGRVMEILSRETYYGDEDELDEFFESYISGRGEMEDNGTSEENSDAPGSRTTGQENSRKKPHKISDVNRNRSPGEGRGRPKSETSDDSYEKHELNIISFPDILQRISAKLTSLYGDQDIKSLERSLKPLYQSYRQEISMFEGYGVEEDKYPRGFFNKIENYVRYHFKLPPKEEVRTFPLDHKGGRTGTNRGMVLAAMNELNYGKYIGHTTLICERLWNYTKPNLSKHRNEILFECLLQKEIFQRLSSSYGRKSNLNQQIIFLIVMRRYGYEWSEEDFNLNFHRNTKIKQTEIMKHIFSIIDQGQGN